MNGAEQHAREDALLRELEALYAEVDAAYALATCEASSECCRFGITGREPQVTTLEVALITRALKARGGPLHARRRALPISGDAARERVCPLLDRDGRCSVYTSRPLGCRTFFCQRASVPEPPTRKELAWSVRRLRELSARHRPSGDEPRALTRALEEPLGG